MTGTELVRDFVNTRELLDPIELFGSPEELGAWLSSNGLAPEGCETGCGRSSARGRATRGPAPDSALEHRGRGRHRGRVLGARHRRVAGADRASLLRSRERPRSRRPRGRRSARADRDRGARRDGRRLVEPAQGVPGLGLRVGVHRHREEPLAAVVLDGVVRQPREGARLPRAPPALSGSAHGDVRVGGRAAELVVTPTASRASS